MLFLKSIGVSNSTCLRYTHTHTEAEQNQLKDNIRKHGWWIPIPILDFLNIKQEREANGHCLILKCFNEKILTCMIIIEFYSNIYCQFCINVLTKKRGENKLFHTKLLTENMAYSTLVVVSSIPSIVIFFSLFSRYQKSKLGSCKEISPITIQMSI